MTSSPDLCTTGLRGQPRSRYHIDCGAARLHIHARSMATVLRVDGEIDASNADLVGQAIRRFARLKAPLIVDLSRLDFLSSAGLHTLLVLDGEHRAAGLHCGVVGGAALRKLTRLIPEHGLSVVDSIPDALRHVEEVIRDRRRLVSGPARQEEPQRAAAVVR